MIESENDTLEDAINLKNILLIIDFLDQNPNLNTIKDTFGRPIMHKAVHEGDSKIVSLFLAYARTNPNKADIQVQDSYGCNMLMTATYLQNPEKIIQLLLDAGVDCNNQSNSGETPLHELVRTNQLLAAEMLLKKGANPNAIQLENDPENLKNITPIHYAAYNGNLEMIKLLTKYSADLTIKCKFVFDNEVIWENTAREIYVPKPTENPDKALAFDKAVAKGLGETILLNQTEASTNNDHYQKKRKFQVLSELLYK